MAVLLVSICVSLLVLCILYLVTEKMLSYNSDGILSIKYKLKTSYDLKSLVMNQNCAQREHYYTLLEKL